MSRTASANRTLNVRLRPDLESTPVKYAGTSTWVVKDPLTLEYFHFTDEEYALLELLKTPRSLSDLQRAYERRFAPLRTTTGAVSGFVGRLHRAGLLLATGADQGEKLAEQFRAERLRGWLLAWTHVLAIRFRGINPDAMLTHTYAQLKPLFSKWTLVPILVLIGYAGALVLGQFDQFVARLPQLEALVDPRNVIWLLLAVSVVKVLHELGHAFMCKHYGGEVHELGLLLLAFTPCLYCDVSDAWQLPSRRQRILISAAGMLVELVLAAAATIVWWHTQPGIVNLVALYIVLVSSVSTLVVNANPLLRYDGYYILSDLTESPNLWQRSREVLREYASRWLLGLRSVGDALTPQRRRGWLATYAVLSKIYLAIVLVSIVWLLVQVLHPLRLQNIAYGIGFLVAGSVVLGPVAGAVRLARNPLRRREVKGPRLTLAVLVVVAASAAILRIPVPYRVRAPLVAMPVEARHVYASVAGTLLESVEPGQVVERGAVIARLKNVEVIRELARLEGEHRLAELRLQHLEALRGHDPAASDDIPASRAALDALSAQLEDRREDAARLTVNAPAAGVILPVRKAAPNDGSKLQLAQWSGSLLAGHNTGAHVEPGTLVALVANPTSLEAVLVVGDTEIERIQAGQPVRLVFDQFPGDVVEGSVREIARHHLGAGVAVHPSASSLARLWEGLSAPGGQEVPYQVRVTLSNPPAGLIAGTRGQAKIATGKLTLARHLLRLISQTFRVQM